jgi:hypothetical protein
VNSFIGLAGKEKENRGRQREEKEKVKGNIKEKPTRVKGVRCGDFREQGDRVDCAPNVCSHLEDTVVSAGGGEDPFPDGGD